MNFENVVLFTEGVRGKRDTRWTGIKVNKQTTNLKITVYRTLPHPCETHKMSIL